MQELKKQREHKTLENVHISTTFEITLASGDNARVKYLDHVNSETTQTTPRKENDLCILKYRLEILYVLYD